MEEKLFIIGVIALIFALVTKFLQKKNVLKKKIFFEIWNVAFALITGGLVFYLINFMKTNGVEGGLGAKGFALITVLSVAGAWYLAHKAAKADEKQSQALYASVLDWANTIYFAAFAAAFIMFFFMQAFKIPSASMRDTLKEGDNLFVNKITYGIRLPYGQKRVIKFNKIKRYDVIVFKFPAEDAQQINCGGPQYGRDFVKRVIGLPGETVEVKNKVIYINHAPLPSFPYEKYEDLDRHEMPMPMSPQEYQTLWENRQLENELGIYLRDFFGPVTLGPNEYFVMGDNRDESCDSRFWGPVPEANVKGKAWFVHWPLSRIKIIK